MTPRTSQSNETSPHLKKIKADIKSLSRAFSSILSDKSSSLSDKSLQHDPHRSLIESLASNVAYHLALDEPSHQLIESALKLYLYAIENSPDDVTWFPSESELSTVCFLDPKNAEAAATCFIWLGKNHLNTPSNQDTILKHITEFTRILPQINLNNLKQPDIIKFNQSILDFLLDQINAEQKLYKTINSYAPPRKFSSQPIEEKDSYTAPRLLVRAELINEIKTLIKTVNTKNLHPILSQHTQETFYKVDTNLCIDLLKQNTPIIIISPSIQLDFIKILFAILHLLQQEQQLLESFQHPYSISSPNAAQIKSKPSKMIAEIIQEILGNNHYIVLLCLWNEKQFLNLSIKTLLSASAEQAYKVYHAIKKLYSSGHSSNWKPSIHEHQIIREYAHHPIEILMQIGSGLNWLGRLSISTTDTRNQLCKMLPHINMLTKTEITLSKTYPLSENLKAALFTHTYQYIHQNISSSHFIQTHQSSSQQLSTPPLFYTPKTASTHNPHNKQKTSSNFSCCSPFSKA